MQPHLHLGFCLSGNHSPSLSLTALPLSVYLGLSTAGVNGDSPVSVSLQMEADVSATARPFAPSATLWQILLNFEEASSGYTKAILPGSKDVTSPIQLLTP